MIDWTGECKHVVDLFLTHVSLKTSIKHVLKKKCFGAFACPLALRKNIKHTKKEAAPEITMIQRLKTPHVVRRSMCLSRNYLLPKLRRPGPAFF